MLALSLLRGMLPCELLHRKALHAFPIGRLFLQQSTLCRTLPKWNSRQARGDRASIFHAPFPNPRNQEADTPAKRPNMRALRAVNTASRKTMDAFSGYKNAVKLVALRMLEAEQTRNRRGGNAEINRAMTRIAQAQEHLRQAKTSLSGAWAGFKAAKALKQVPQTTLDHMEQTKQLRLEHIDPSTAEEIAQIVGPVIQGSNPVEDAEPEEATDELDAEPEEATDELDAEPEEDTDELDAAELD